MMLNPCAYDELRAQNNNEQLKTIPETRSELKPWRHEKWSPENGSDREIYQPKGNLPAILCSQPHGGGSTGASPSSIPIQLLIWQCCA